VGVYKSGDTRRRRTDEACTYEAERDQHAAAFPSECAREQAASKASQTTLSAASVCCFRLPLRNPFSTTRKTTSAVARKSATCIDLSRSYVETADAEELWWDDADAEDNRLRKLGAKACRRLLALLQQHHEYATGELELRTRKRAA
jgi:hypothetical protein